MEPNRILDTVKKIDRPVVVYLSIQADENCKKLEDKARLVADQFKGRVNFLVYHVEEFDPVLRELFVLELPTLILFNQGREIARLVGDQPGDAVDGLFQMVLHNPKQTGLHLSLFDRLIRLMVGTAIIILGYMNEESWIIMILGFILILLAFWDRFDWLYRSLAYRFKNDHG